MRVALGTIEVDDDTRKKIRSLSGGKGDATRGEVKDYILEQVKSQVLPNVGSEDGTVSSSSGDEEANPRVSSHRHAADAQSAEPAEGDTLPEPTTGGTTATASTTASQSAGTSPSTGNLGSAGTAGGTTSG